MPERDYVRLTDAAEEFGVSRVKLSNLIKRGRIKVYEDPKDARVRLLDRVELREYFQIRPTER